MMQEKLDQAIEKYVDALELKGLVDYVTNDLKTYYTESADSEEAEMFIQEMGIDDESWSLFQFT